MTTEHDFQAALNANPQDWQTRLVFADWLQERGDPRAEGYAALGRPGCRPTGYTVKDTATLDANEAAFWCYWTEPYASPPFRLNDLDWLPLDWFRAIPQLPEETERYNRRRKTRRELDDAAALAFAKLPAARRAELLAQPAGALR